MYDINKFKMVKQDVSFYIFKRKYQEKCSKILFEFLKQIFIQKIPRKTEINPLN